MVYLFIGQDSLSKDTQLKKIKQEFLQKGLEQFNTDILYADDLSLAGLQENLLCLPAGQAGLPLKGQKRMVVIRQAQKLKEDVQEFILKYVKNPFSGLILVLDVERKDPREKIQFVEQIERSCRTYRFREPPAEANTFALSRQIDLRKPDYALKTLNQLLRNGEKPERILGGLRYAWERSAGSPQKIRKVLRLLLDCDVEIKTGRLKPAFALEKLVVKLSSL